MPVGCERLKEAVQTPRHDYNQNYADDDGP
jgi:hypothetical protein